MYLMTFSCWKREAYESIAYHTHKYVFNAGNSKDLGSCGVSLHPEQNILKYRK
jgi:hypothetical protein